MFFQDTEFEVLVKPPRSLNVSWLYYRTSKNRFEVEIEADGSQMSILVIAEIMKINEII